MRPADFDVGTIADEFEIEQNSISSVGSFNRELVIVFDENLSIAPTT